jgi:hypothetical protein
MPTFETTTQALIECVKAAGGSKQVGHKVFPEKTVDQAQRHLLNCLNDERQERLTPDQVLLIAKLARDHGCHAYAHHVAQVLGYAEPVPVEPKDEADELRRQLLEMGKALQSGLARLEGLERVTLRAAA